jgi:hypothetical protein
MVSNISQKQLAYILLTLIGSIFVIHTVAQIHFLYWKYWWFDMPMHFFGGVFLGFLAVYIYIFIVKQKIFSIKIQWIVMILGFVFVVGLGWEVYEFFIDQSFTTRTPNYFDTISDLFFDLAGGCMSILFLIKKRIL